MRQRLDRPDSKGAVDLWINDLESSTSRKRTQRVRHVDKNGDGVLLTKGSHGVRGHVVGGRGGLGLAVDVRGVDGDGRCSQWC